MQEQVSAQEEAVAQENAEKTQAAEPEAQSAAAIFNDVLMHDPRKADYMDAWSYGLTAETYLEQNTRAGNTLSSIGFDEMEEGSKLEFYAQQKSAYKAAKKEKDPVRMAYYGSILGKMDAAMAADYDLGDGNENDALAEEASKAAMSEGQTGKDGKQAPKTGGESEDEEETEKTQAGKMNVGANILSRLGLGVGGYALGSGISGIFIKGDDIGSRLARAGIGIAGVIGMEMAAKPVMQLVADVLPEGKAKDWAQKAANSLGSFTSNENINSPVQQFLKQQAEGTSQPQGSSQTQQAQTGSAVRTGYKDVTALTGYDGQVDAAYEGLQFTTARLGTVYSDPKYVETMSQMGKKIIETDVLKASIELGEDYKTAVLSASSVSMRSAEEGFALAYQEAGGKMTSDLQGSLNDYSSSILSGLEKYSANAQYGIGSKYGHDPKLEGQVMVGLQDINQANTTAAMESLAYMESKYHFMTPELKEKMDNLSMPGVESAGAYFDTFLSKYEGQAQAGMDAVRSVDYMGAVAEYLDTDSLNYGETVETDEATDARRKANKTRLTSAAKSYDRAVETTVSPRGQSAQEHFKDVLTQVEGGEQFQI